jgi:2,4-dienoyl-CoA reductase-like NADH-dependent reductase (Old Yellow Enzyme family)
MSLEQIEQLKAQFVTAAKRADRLGFELIELHGAHGYLLHQFLSPLSNQRNDQYGGSLQNRMRLLLEIYNEVRAVFPAQKALGVRISASDWVEGGWDEQQSVALAKALKELGCDYIHVSSVAFRHCRKSRWGRITRYRSPRPSSGKAGCRPLPWD